MRIRSGCGGCRGAGLRRPLQASESIHVSLPLFLPEAPSFPPQALVLIRSLPPDPAAPGPDPSVLRDAYMSFPPSLAGHERCLGPRAAASQ